MHTSDLKSKKIHSGPQIDSRYTSLIPLHLGFKCLARVILRYTGLICSHQRYERSSFIASISFIINVLPSMRARGALSLTGESITWLEYIKSPPWIHRKRVTSDHRHFFEYVGSKHTCAASRIAHATCTFYLRLELHVAIYQSYPWPICIYTHST